MCHTGFPLAGVDGHGWCESKTVQMMGKINILKYVCVCVCPNEWARQGGTVHMGYLQLCEKFEKPKKKIYRNHSYPWYIINTDFYWLNPLLSTL